MADYYVTSAARGGSDANPGTLLAPWETVAKVNGSSFSGGDSVNFDRGVKWREQCNFPSAGAAGNPITIGAYGVGDLPILSGFNVMTGFADGGSNIWDKTGVTTDPRVVIVNNYGPLWKKRAASRAACVAPGDWFWVANTLSVYATSDPSGNVEASQRSRGISNGASRDHLIIQDLYCTGANDDAGISLGGAFTNITLRRCVCFQNSFSGLVVGGAVFTGLTVEDCTFSYSGNNGVMMYEFNTTGLVFCRNLVEYNGIRDATPGTSSGFVHYGKQAEVAYNRFIGNGSMCVVQNGTEHGFYQNTVDDASIFVHHNVSNAHTRGNGLTLQSTCLVEHNSLDGNQSGIYLGSNGTFNIAQTVQRNVITNTKSRAITQQAKGAGTLSIYIYHNTVWNTDTDGIGGGGGYDIFNDCTVLDIRNNIFAIGSTGRMCWLRVAPTGTVTIDYNIVHDPADATPYRFVSTEENLAAWQARGYDLNGLNADPLFVNAAAGDFHLKATSPSKNAGVLIPGMNADFDGVGVPIGPAPDIGAFEERSTLLHSFAAL